MIQLFDTVQIDDSTVRRTRDGYLVASARTARTGVQAYRAQDLGDAFADRDPSSIVKVYRPPEAVFASDALAGMAYRPMTNDHPRGKVTALNWKDHAVGQTGGEIVRDGQFVRVPLVLMDAGAIQDYESGKRELSWGYGAEIHAQDGVVPEGVEDAGETYDAVMTNFTPNHLALCTKARGGDKLRIGDNTPDTSGANPGDRNVNLKTILVDGLQVETTPAGEAAINVLTTRLADAKTTLAQAQTQITTLSDAASAKDGEIAALKAQLADATVTPEKLAQLVADRARLVAAAKPLLGDSFAFDGKTDAEIRKAAVTLKLKDAAAALDDAGIAAAFLALTATGATKAPVTDQVRQIVADGALDSVEDAQAAYDAAKAKRATRLADAWAAPVSAQA